MSASSSNPARRSRARRSLTSSFFFWSWRLRSENCRDDVSFASRPSSASRSRDESRSTSSSLASAWLRDDARSSFRRRRTSSARSAWSRAACSDLCGNHRVDLHANFRRDACSMTHWLISTQVPTGPGAVLNPSGAWCCPGPAYRSSARAPSAPLSTSNHRNSRRAPSAPRVRTTRPSA